MDRGKDKKVNKQGLTEEEFLAAYDPSKFERPSVTVDMLIFTEINEKEDNVKAGKNENTIENDEKYVAHQKCLSKKMLSEKGLKLLMIKRGDHPCIGQWALPGGFVNMDESLDEAAQRELKEETNISEAYMEQLYTWGDVGRDPRTRIISTSYIAIVDSSALDVAAGDDADDAKWFDVFVELLHEQKIFGKTDNNNMIEQAFKLTLTNESESLSAIIKKIKTINENKSVWKNKAVKTRLEIVEPGGIAFDHAKIIFHGIEKIYSEILG